jgi:hypothetical protein
MSEAPLAGGPIAEETALLATIKFTNRFFFGHILNLFVFEAAPKAGGEAGGWGTVFCHSSLPIEGDRTSEVYYRVIYMTSDRARDYAARCEARNRVR